MKKTFELTYLKSTKRMHVYEHSAIGAHYLPIDLFGGEQPETIKLTVDIPSAAKKSDEKVASEGDAA